jgi:hypothetical protein
MLPHLVTVLRAPVHCGPRLAASAGGAPDASPGASLPPDDTVLRTGRLGRLDALIPKALAAHTTEAGPYWLTGEDPCLGHPSEDRLSLDYALIFVVMSVQLGERVSSFEKSLTCKPQRFQKLMPEDRHAQRQRGQKSFALVVNSWYAWPTLRYHPRGDEGGQWWPSEARSIARPLFMPQHKEQLARFCALHPPTDIKKVQCRALEIFLVR